MAFAGFAKAVATCPEAAEALYLLSPWRRPSLPAMHWLVEVSRVGDTVPSERYCIDARRWQSALQEARRLRGDAGALPKLTIELTDNGYRAVDPALKVRYLVTEAPPGTPLTDGARAILSTAPPPAVESNAPKSPSVPAPAAAVTSAAPPAAVPAPPAPVAAPPAVAAPLPVAAARPSVSNVAPAAAPAFTAASAAPVESVPPAGTPSSVPPPPPLPSTQVIRQREERPTDANPIAYRELALAVKAGVSRSEVEAVLRKKLDEVRAMLPEETRRYVQLAVFDHVFVKRPVRPPLGTLQWKDWRGDPVLAFPGFGESASDAPPSSVSTSRMPSWSPGMMTSVAPLGSVSQVPPVANHVSASPGTSAPVASASAPVTSASVPVPSAEPARPVSVIPARVVSVTSSPPAAVRDVAGAIPAAARVPVVPEPDDVPLALATVRASTAPAPAAAKAVADGASAVAPVAEPAPSGEPAVTPAPGVMAAEPVPPADVAPAPAPAPAVERPSQPPAERRSDPSLKRRSDPHLARRRAPGEDLIGDLFERMHELAFMPDIVSGAEFVVRVLSDLIPCEGTLVHVFDLGRREFVVVRARGPAAASALMFRTPDSDPFVIEVMRRPSMAANGAAPKHSKAFDALGVAPRQVMARGARHGGRYLGMIELGNPQGGSPFHESEVNALEYVCEQFADFVASRPIVLDEDLVRAHAN